MGSVNQGYNDRIRYILRNINFTDIIITEPEGWRSDQVELERSKTSHGVFQNFSNHLKFVLDGAEHIKLIRALYGIEAEIKLIREERDPVTDIWNQIYYGFLDLSTYENEDGKVSVKFNSGGLEQLLKSRDSEQAEIDRITTIDRYPIDNLQPIEVEVDGREIFLKSDYKVQSDVNSVEMTNNTGDGNVRGSTVGVPLYLVSKSHENAQSVLPGGNVGDNSWERTANGEVSNLFFANSDSQRILHIKFRIDFTVDITTLDDVDFFNFWLRLAHYQNGTDYNIKENRFLFNKSSYGDLNNKRYSVTFDEMITIEKGDSLSLCFDQNYDGRALHSSRLTTVVKDIVCDNFTVEEDSFFDKSVTKSVLIFEMFDRLITICTNQKNSLRSSLFGRTDLGYPVDGKWSLIGFSHGFWVRGFDKLPIPSENPKVENLFKPLTTSFKEVFDSTHNTINIGFGIEKEGNKDIVVIEELAYFYNRNVLVRLPNQIKKVKRSEAPDYYYSSLEFGYEKGGDYQEAMGLDEPNTKSKFTTVISRLKNTFSKVSKIRADAYGFEFARRKPVSLNNTEDTTYDNDIWFQDLKRGLNNVFLQRKWQDDFEKAPTGIFSPNTAFNLRFSPFNMLLRHGWYFGSGFDKYLSDFVSYASSVANSKMKTQLIGKPEYAEDGIIQNSELERARFVCEEIEFDHICDYEVMKQINGSTVIQGKTIKNMYGLIEFINEKGEIERGFLLNLKPTGEGKFKVIKFNN